MKEASKNLPRFNKPPVAEVVLGVQFSPLQGAHVGHVGMLWQRYRDRFPNVSQQLPISHTIERPGVQFQGGLPTISMMALGEMPQRTWFVNSENTDLIQVQSDRFIRNWRRYHDSTIPYPSYE